MLTPKHPRNPVTAFFRGLYAELAFSGESLRINGVGLLFGLVTGLVVGVCGGVFARLLDVAADVRNGTAWAMYLLPLAGLMVVWMYRRGGIKTAGGTDLIIQAARGEQPVSRLLAPVIFAATLLTHVFGGSAGREGAALQLGGSLSELIRKGAGMGESYQDLAIMCGMSAGFSAVFGSQIAAALFALEISCVGILPLGGLFPCVVSSLTAGTIARAMGVHGVSFILTASTADVVFYGQVVALSLACGLLSTIVCYTFAGVRSGLERLFPNPYLRVLVGSAAVLGLTTLLRHDRRGDPGGERPASGLRLEAPAHGPDAGGRAEGRRDRAVLCHRGVLRLCGRAAAGPASALRRRHWDGGALLRRDQLPADGAGLEL